ncbi:centrosomal protein of 164 kDa isoform X2 [Venturia canescens]|uniref:centrosomal protein of 164 kDa isoform X2 n=1 Tax=Venturia canescens TaxID=32260 RepID=UPI001C9BF2B9|nr:centrosomal protein of 164 kDa isoform X2 [Venturia canescens]
MSISQDSGAVIVCREVFDEASHPSNEEILDYARRVGIDPETESHLLDLAREGLMAPLPKGWTPCLDENTGSWYYYQASTKTTTWEHPLDAKNRALVERARASGTRQHSLDDDSKTTAKELDSHEEASLPKESKLAGGMTKIPTKLAPLRKSSLDSIVRPKKEASLSHRRVSIEPAKPENPNCSLMTDRASRDYTKVVFQDPKFYETPRLLGSPEREMRLKEIVKRSESMSPRYEKDWEQLSSRFNSEENVIDIDKLSASSLTRSETKSSIERFDKEKHPRNLSQQKELTLTGGGFMFLKSNRSRDTTPCQDSGKIDDFQRASTPGDNFPITPGERPKSILREKPPEIEEKATTDEERKSVRFDLEKPPDDIKFTFTSFDDENDDEEKKIGASEEKEGNEDNSDSESVGSVNYRLRKSEPLNQSLRRVESQPRIGPIVGKRAANAWLMDLDSMVREYGAEGKSNELEESINSKEEKPAVEVKLDAESEAEERTTSLKEEESEGRENLMSDGDGNVEKKNGAEGDENEKNQDEATSKPTKIIGRRFLVENVSEKEHLSQLSNNDSTDVDQDYLPKNKFSNIRNIDIYSKSESESRSSNQDESKSSMLDDIRRNKEIMLENMKRTDQRAKKDEQREREQVYQMIKLRQDLETVSQEQQRGRTSSRSNSNEVKSVMHKQHDRELLSYKRELEVSLAHSKRQMEENFAIERAKFEAEMEKRMEELRIELGKKEKQEIETLIAEMDQLRKENLKKVRNELEICYEKERQDILENLKIELDQRKRELLELRNQEMDKLLHEHENSMAEEKALKLAELEINKQQNEKIEEMKKQLEKEFDDLRNDLRTRQREKIMKITEDHEKCLAEILRDFRMDESLARKVYKQRLEEIRSDFSRDTEKEAKKQAERVNRQETVDFEKIRCEKRLLEDKYKTLKDKYSKLKNDVRLAVERRSKRKEGNATTSETEKSTSVRTRTDRTDSSDQKASPTNTRSSSIVNNAGYPRAQKPGFQQQQQQQQQQQPDSSNPNKSQAEDSECGGRSSTGGFSRAANLTAGDCSSRSSAKFESDDATTASETVNSNILKNKRKSFARRSSSSVKQSQNNNNSSTSNNNNNNSSNAANGTENPVENIRKQLEKLEDLGDQLPSTETAYTLRYPFQDKTPPNTSSELEFFRHRIHVERDSVKRAREALRVQRSAFQSRQRAWKQKSVRATLEQLVQEERELSDMEVSLHRTRSLLGEKVIYLRHLEQSLERVANTKRNETESVPLKSDEMTLSDMSSASSGFSSTDLASDTFIGNKPDHYQESTEIIASLENLNSEIREIWGVLNKRQDNNIPPPPTLMYSDLGWLPFQHLTTQSNNVQGFGTPNIQSNILSQLTASHPPTTTTQNIIAQYGPTSGFTTSVGTVERGGASSLIERTRHMRDWLRQARIETTDPMSPGQATL